jgi:hypothetical protein
MTFFYLVSTQTAEEQSTQEQECGAKWAPTAGSSRGAWSLWLYDVDLKHDKAEQGAPTNSGEHGQC